LRGCSEQDAVSDRRRHASADCELSNHDEDHPEERDGNQNPNTKAELVPVV
jgi:hypothetical protein